MPLLTAHLRPPKFWAVEATLVNLSYLENMFRDGEVSVSADRKFIRLYRVFLPEIKKSENITQSAATVVVAEGDYFVWEHGFVRESLQCVEKHDFEDRYIVDETLDTGHG